MSSTSTSTPSRASSAARRANSTGNRTFGGSLTRVRASSHTLGDARGRGGPRLDGGGIGHRDRDGDRLALVLVVLRLGLVAVEPVGAQLQALREIRRSLRAGIAVRQVEQDRGPRALPQLAHDEAAERHHGAAVALRRLRLSVPTTSSRP